MLMLTLIENGELYAPEPLGHAGLLIVRDQIARVGDIHQSRQALGLPIEVIDATDCVVAPGFIDPHEHLLGGSGENGWNSQTPEIAMQEIAMAGITTVVGCLGVDTITKTMTALLARARSLYDDGLTAYVFTGGYDVPPRTLTGSVRSDLLLVPEVIGAGEVAIADQRSSEPTDHELARLCRDTHVGGLLSRKAGVTHFHVGEGRSRLQPLRTLLDNYDLKPDQLYPTHIGRSEALIREAVELSHRGVTVDIDTVDQDLPRWLKFYRDEGGNLDCLTVSSDAAINSPRSVWEQVRSCVFELGLSIECALSLITSNTARTLKLHTKGRLAPGCDADIVVLRRNTLEIRDVIARGHSVVRGGRLCRTERALHSSNRRIELYGDKS
jgi:beta-aspartyl-dipeptidase (metallo-type)